MPMTLESDLSQQLVLVTDFSLDQGQACVPRFTGAVDTCVKSNMRPESMRQELAIYFLNEEMNECR
jgi:hypothetical protein